MPTTINGRATHRYLKYHFIRGMTQWSEVELSYSLVSDQVVNIFTQSVDNSQFLKLQDQFVGPLSMKEEYESYVILVWTDLKTSHLNTSSSWLLQRTTHLVTNLELVIMIYMTVFLTWKTFLINNIFAICWLKMTATVQLDRWRGVKILLSRFCTKITEDISRMSSLQSWSRFYHEFQPTSVCEFDETAAEPLLQLSDPLHTLHEYTRWS